MKHAEKTRGDSVMDILLNTIEASSDLRGSPSVPQTKHPLILRVIEYIEENLTTVACCEEIASRFFISRYRLEHLFKECVDISLWDYVIIKRLLHFNTVVRSGRSIKEAAYASGFKNYSNFYRLYKKHMNHTPTEFKQQIRSDAHTSSK